MMARVMVAVTITREARRTFGLLTSSRKASMRTLLSKVSIQQ